jgi:DNA-binding transcriptional ArsR family regulator
MNTDALRRNGDGPKQLGNVIQILKSMANETRLTMLWHLMERPLTVRELEALTDLPQAKVSQQLGKLRMDGVVSAKRDGRHVWYQIRSPEIHTMIESLAAAKS